MSVAHLRQSGHHRKLPDSWSAVTPRLSTLVLSLVSLVSALSQPPTTFAHRTVFQRPANEGWTDSRVLYARSAQLADGILLATWENYSPEPLKVYFPIFQSKDGGYTWKELSRVQDTVNGWRLRYQPFLYVLQDDMGGYKKGTVLLAGSSIPTDLSRTQIDLYASADNGIWEPFLMEYSGTLIHYYSDQRENATYGQKMVHQTTTDLKTWGPFVNDAAYPKYTDRPGMPTVALLPNGKYILAYEYGGGPAISGSYQFPVCYKIVSDPERFGTATGISLKATDDTIPSGSQYIVWSAVGGKNGTLIVGANNNTEIFINKGLGEGP